MAQFGKFALAAAMVSMIGSPVLAAASDPVRPAVLSPAIGTRLGTIARAGMPMGKKQDLLGAPLFLVFLGAVAVTIGTVIIVNNNNGSSSPS